MVPLGSIHGRFQPFHNAHLVYAKTALQYVERLYIGLTKILSEQTIGEDLAPHRFQPDQNPLSYYQRVEVTKRALLEANIDPGRFDIGPFPVEVPGRLPEFWPVNALCLTTNVADWNERKIQILKNAGYEVQVLDLNLSNLNVASGRRIREMFRSGKDTWQRYVPTGTLNCLLENDWRI